VITYDLVADEDEKGDSKKKMDPERKQECLI
jgi:hypothetical protein